MNQKERMQIESELMADAAKMLQIVAMYFNQDSILDNALKAVIVQHVAEVNKTIFKGEHVDYVKNLAATSKAYLKDLEEIKRQRDADKH